MGCCRSTTKKLSRPGVVAVCANCHNSLREAVKEAVATKLGAHPSPGTYRISVQVQCRCGYQNKISTTATKR